MTAGSRALHVERTGDPAVLRWVLHSAVLDASPPGTRLPPATSPLGRLLDAGDLLSVSVLGGDVFVRAPGAARWPALASVVRVALLDELDELDAAVIGGGREHWMLVVGPDGHAPLTLGELQTIVDRAAGRTLAEHGGSMVVVHADESHVVIRATGACHGCVRADDTVLALIRPAIAAADPRLVDVSLTSGEPLEGPSGPPARRRWRAARRRGGRACH